MENFTYLVSALSHSTKIDDEVVRWISKASQAIGRLQSTVWNRHGRQFTMKLKTIETSADASANADQCQAGLYDNAAPPELPTPGANFVSDFDTTQPSRRHPSSRGPRLRTSQSRTPSQPAAAFRARSQSLLLIIRGKFDVNARDDLSELPFCKHRPRAERA
ncbi:hypothetical protein SprV_1002839100 [Sparganum proliferum]